MALASSVTQDRLITTADVKVPAVDGRDGYAGDCRARAAVAGDTRGRVLYVGSFSKTMLPAIRLGFVMAPQSVRRALKLARYVSDWHSPLAPQAALAHFIDEGLLARHIRRMRGEYESRHERHLQVLAGQGDWLRPIECAAVMHLTAVLPRDRYLSPQDELERTHGSGVAVNSLSAFYAGSATRSGLVLGYGAVPLQKIEDGLQLLRRLPRGRPGAGGGTVPGRRGRVRALGVRRRCGGGHAAAHPVGLPHPAAR